MDHDDALAYLKSFTSSFTGVKNADVIISNASEASTAAVNALLKAGKTVGMITDGAYMGDFICSYADYLTVSDRYILSATGVNGGVNAKLIAKSPTVYVSGVPVESKEGFLYTQQIGQSFGWSYDNAAMALMGFTVTESLSKADAVAGASALSADAMAAVKSGLPYIGYSSAVAASVSELVSGAEYTKLSGAMDCLTPVTYPTKTLVNASYIADGDDTLYAYGLGYFSKLPDGASVLVKADGSKAPTEGFIPTNTAERAAGFKAYMNGGVQGFAYQKDDMNIVLFANTLTNKVHQRDEYAYISNFLFSSVLSDKSYGTGSAVSFSDVPSNAYYAEGVAWAVAKQITDGVGDGRFEPNTDCSRAQIVTFLWRAAGSPVVNYAMNFSDVAEGEWYAEAVRWAASEGVTTGLPNGTFGVTDTCTRAQVVAFLYRYAQKAGMDVSVGEDTNILSYNDALTVQAWAIPAFQWACGAGVVQGSGGALMPGNFCTRGQIVTMLCRALAA